MCLVLALAWSWYDGPFSTANHKPFMDQNSHLLERIVSFPTMIPYSDHGTLFPRAL